MYSRLTVYRMVAGSSPNAIRSANESSCLPRFDETPKALATKPSNTSKRSTNPDHVNSKIQLLVQRPGHTQTTAIKTGQGNQIGDDIATEFCLAIQTTAQKGLDFFSWPMVVGEPCPLKTVVSAGRENIFWWMLSIKV